MVVYSLSQKSGKFCLECKWWDTFSSSDRKIPEINRNILKRSPKFRTEISKRKTRFTAILELWSGRNRPFSIHWGLFSKRYMANPNGTYYHAFLLTIFTNRKKQCIFLHYLLFLHRHLLVYHLMFIVLSFSGGLQVRTDIFSSLFEPKLA